MSAVASGLKREVLRLEKGWVCFQQLLCSGELTDLLRIREGVQEDDGFHFFNEACLQAFVNCQTVVIPVVGVVKRKDKVVIRDIVDIANVVTADIPEFDVLSRAIRGVFRKFRFSQKMTIGFRAFGYKGTLVY